MIDQLTVVVPAHDEGDRIGAALLALTRSAARLRQQEASVSVRIIVVLDRCTDSTADVVAGFRSVETLSSSSGRVGAVRAVGMDHAISTRTGDLDSLWLACTDADSRVPVGWLRHHVAIARSGVDLLLGTVRPTLSPARLALWHQGHQLEDGHDHVHGANLGVRASTYLAVGGFEDVTEHEDLYLARQVRDQGARVLASGSAAVITSARTVGRTPGGMAGYLRNLAG